MYVMKNVYFTKRDYECTNVVAATYETRFKPGQLDSLKWEPCGPSILKGLNKLWIENGVTYYGYL
jgi:hypothetical protein